MVLASIDKLACMYYYIVGGKMVIFGMQILRDVSPEIKVQKV